MMALSQIEACSATGDEREDDGSPFGTAVARGEFADIVRESDRFYEEDVCTAAELVKGRLDEVKIMIIAGPSSSGKTTTTIKLENALKEVGVNLLCVGSDVGLLRDALKDRLETLRNL